MELLAEAYRETGRPAFLEAAKQKVAIGVLPGQLTDGPHTDKAGGALFAIVSSRMRWTGSAKASSRAKLSVAACCNLRAFSSGSGR